MSSAPKQGDERLTLFNNILEILATIEEKEDELNELKGKLALSTGEFVKGVLETFRPSGRRDGYRLAQTFWRLLFCFTGNSKEELSGYQARICEYLKSCRGERTEGGLGGCGEFVVLLECLKRARAESICNELPDNEKRKCRGLLSSPLVNTCYDGDRASRLLRGLSILNSDLVKLLALAYARMVGRPLQEYEKYEPIPLLIKSFVLKHDRNAYIPTCPSEGDVIALLYYMALRMLRSDSG